MYTFKAASIVNQCWWRRRISLVMFFFFVVRGACMYGCYHYMKCIMVHVLHTHIMRRPYNICTQCRHSLEHTYIHTHSNQHNYTCIRALVISCMLFETLHLEDEYEIINCYIYQSSSLISSSGRRFFASALSFIACGYSFKT